jgi:hypothetical protein
MPVLTPTSGRRVKARHVPDLTLVRSALGGPILRVCDRPPTAEHPGGQITLTDPELGHLVRPIHPDESLEIVAYPGEYMLAGFYLLN